MCRSIRRCSFSAVDISNRLCTPVPLCLMFSKLKSSRKEGETHCRKASIRSLAPSCPFTTFSTSVAACAAVALAVVNGVVVSCVVPVQWLPFHSSSSAGAGDGCGVVTVSLSVVSLLLSAVVVCILLSLSQHWVLVL